jgi:hypothetical protein
VKSKLLWNAVTAVAVFVAMGMQTKADSLVFNQVDFFIGSNQGGAGFWSATFSGVYPKDLAQTFVVANTGTLSEVMVPVTPQSQFLDGEVLFSIVPIVGGVPVENLALALA